MTQFCVEGQLTPCVKNITQRLVYFSGTYAQCHVCCSQYLSDYSGCVVCNAVRQECLIAVAGEKKCIGQNAFSVFHLHLLPL